MYSIFIPHVFARRMIRSTLRRLTSIHHLYNPKRSPTTNGQSVCFKPKVNYFCSGELVNPERDKCSAEKSQCQLVDEVMKAIEDGLCSNKNNLNVENASKVVNYLLQEGAKPEDLAYGFTNQPESANKHWTCWKSSVGMLRGIGANIDQILQIIAYNPLVLDYSSTRLNPLIDAMQATGISSSDLVDRLTETPEMLNFNANEINRRHEALKLMFTKKDISKMVSRNIKVLSVSSRDIERKLQYIVHRMGLEQPQVVHSQALVNPMQELMERHEFLVRTGQYRTPNPKARELSCNVLLRDISDSSNKYFATKIAKVTLEEYELFCRLAKEKKNVLNKTMHEDNIEDDDDDDDDE